VRCHLSQFSSSTLYNIPYTGAGLNDVAYFITTGVDGLSREKLDRLLSVYHSAFAERCLELGLPNHFADFGFLQKALYDHYPSHLMCAFIVFIRLVEHAGGDVWKREKMLARMASAFEIIRENYAS